MKVFVNPPLNSCCLQWNNTPMPTDRPYICITSTKALGRCWTAVCDCASEYVYMHTPSQPHSSMLRISQWLLLLLPGWLHGKHCSLLRTRQYRQTSPLHFHCSVCPSCAGLLRPFSKQDRPAASPCTMAVLLLLACLLVLQTPLLPRLRCHMCTHSHVPLLVPAPALCLDRQAPALSLTGRHQAHRLARHQALAHHQRLQQW